MQRNSFFGAFVVFCSSIATGIAPCMAQKNITGISIVGQAVKIFDHTQRVEELNINDGQLYAWKEADGTVNLMMSCYEAYRLRGPDVLNLTFDPNKVYSATQSGMYIQEDLYNNLQWPMGPYSEDGRNFYALAHHEWYGCLLDGGITDGKWPDWGYLSTRGGTNSWVTTVNSLKSPNGGASWQLNDVNGNHVVAKPGYHWTGSEALANQIYLHADNKTGLQQITHIIKEGSYYYAMGNLYHRDFSQVNPGAGVWQAPMDKEGIVILRTADYKNPNGWEVWVGGSSYSPVASTQVANWAAFYPNVGGATVTAWSPTFVYDTNAQAYILIFCPKNNANGNGPIYYITSKSLANPSWSNAVAITGTSTFTTDPAATPYLGGPWQGFKDCYYPSIIDPGSPGYNFEFTSSGSPWLFWSTAPGLYGHREIRNDMYRAQLQITYDNPRPAPLSFTVTSVNGGIVTKAYKDTLTIAGGTAPYAWSMASGRLPAGLTLNSTNGIISGTPTAGEVTVFTAKVKDARGDSVVKQFSIKIAAQALVGWWKFSSNAADSSGNGNAGTLNGGTSWTSGMSGNAVNLNGTSGYVGYGTDATLNFESGAEFTVTGWVKTTDGYGTIVSQRNSGSDGAVLNIMVGYDGAVTSAGKLMAMVRQDGGSAGYARITGGTVNNDAWHHVALKRSSNGTIELFLNGATQGTDSKTESGGAITTDLRAIGLERRWVQDGYATADQRYLAGAVDEVMIYNYALTAQAIAAQYNAGKLPVVTKPGLLHNSGAFRADYGGVKIYQNLDYSGTVTFVNLTSNTILKIYTLAGSLVRTLYSSNSGNTGRLAWDGKNQNNKPINVGLFFYELTDANANRKLGKVNIVR